MIRVLHYIPAFDIGGIENLVLSIYKNIDLNEVQFDFLVEKEIPQEYKKMIQFYGGKIFILPKMTNFSLFFEYLQSLKKIFKNEKYDVFHCHSWDTRPFPIYYATKYGINIRIAHAHFVNFNNRKHILLKRILTNFGIAKSNLLIACSTEAGKAIFKDRKYIVLNNGIDIKKYMFNPHKRDLMRKKYNIKESEIVYINVGRLTPLKNQIFLIDLFEKIHMKLKNSKLYIIGTGPLKDDIEERILSSKLKKSILIIENVYNVEDYLSMSDVFLFPSISEGLGLSYIEAQVNGLCSYVSTGIPSQVSIGKNCHIFSLSESVGKLAKQISQNDDIMHYPYENYEMFKCYDICNISREYVNILKMNKR